MLVIASLSASKTRVFTCFTYVGEIMLKNVDTQVALEETIKRENACVLICLKSGDETKITGDKGRRTYKAAP